MIVELLVVLSLTNCFMFLIIRIKLERSTSSAVHPLELIVYARHGRELMGLKSPVSVPCNVVRRNILLADGKGVTVR